jgi:hypothetical protein
VSLEGMLTSRRGGGIWGDRATWPRVSGVWSLQRVTSLHLPALVLTFLLLLCPCGGGTEAQGAKFGRCPLSFSSLQCTHHAGSTGTEMHQHILRRLQQLKMKGY